MHEYGDKFTVLPMQTDKSSTTFLSGIDSRLKAHQGEASLIQSDSTVVDTSIGTGLVMGTIAWLILFSLYHWLA